MYNDKHANITRSTRYNKPPTQPTSLGLFVMAMFIVLGFFLSIRFLLPLLAETIENNAEPGQVGLLYSTLSN